MRNSYMYTLNILLTLVISIQSKENNNQKQKKS
jgi:hypothetical protein